MACKKIDFLGCRVGVSGNFQASIHMCSIRQTIMDTVNTIMNATNDASVPTTEDTEQQTYLSNFIRDVKNEIVKTLPLFVEVRRPAPAEHPPSSLRQCCEDTYFVQFDLSTEIQKIDNVNVFDVTLVFDYDLAMTLPNDATEFSMTCEVKLEMDNQRACSTFVRNNNVETITNTFSIMKTTHKMTRPDTSEQWIDDLCKVADFKHIYEGIHQVLSHLRFSHIHQSFYDYRRNPHYGFHAYMSTPTDECIVCYRLTTHTTACNHHLCMTCNNKLFKVAFSPCPCCRQCLRCNTNESCHDSPFRCPDMSS